jgi:hypothetical protein
MDANRGDGRGIQKAIGKMQCYESRRVQEFKSSMVQEFKGSGVQEKNMAKNLVAQVSKAGGEFELVEREIPQPGVGEVRIKVEACGICHSDQIVKHGGFPGLNYPRVPGHEVVGFVEEVGSGVTEIGRAHV